MPRTCSVPHCNSNYHRTLKENPKIVQTFAFPPDDPDRCRQWLRAIHRENFVPTKHSAVCIRHFHEKHIIKVSQKKRNLGVKLKFPYLTKDAVPSIFLNCPSYMISDLSAERRDLDERHQALVERNGAECGEWQAENQIQSFQDLSNTTEPQSGLKDPDEEQQALVKSSGAECEEWQAEDQIQSFQELSNNYHSKNLSNFSVQKFPGFIYFYKIHATLSSVPQISCGVKIFANLEVQAYVRDTPLPTKRLKAMLNSDAQCTHWSEFETLLSHLSSLETSYVFTFEENMEEVS